MLTVIVLWIAGLAFALVLVRAGSLADSDLRG